MNIVLRGKFCPAIRSNAILPTLQFLRDKWHNRYYRV